MKQTRSTREQIVYMLRSRGRMQASELAQHLQITGMAVRRHIYELQKQGYIDTISIKQAMGRPLHEYELTDKAEELFPRNYEALAEDLLSELSESPTTAPLVDFAFQGRKHKLYQRYEGRMRDKSLEDRVQELVHIQNAAGYMAEVHHEEGTAFYLTEYNCPIRTVAYQYEQACRCELELFSELLGVSVERTECLAKGGTKCNYKIYYAAN